MCSVASFPAAFSERKKEITWHFALSPPTPHLHVSFICPVFITRLTARRDTKSLELSELTGRRSAVEVEIQEAEAALRAAGTESAKLSEQLDEVLKQVCMFLHFAPSCGILKS